VRLRWRRVSQNEENISNNDMWMEIQACPFEWLDCGFDWILAVQIQRNESDRQRHLWATRRTTIYLLIWMLEFPFTCHCLKHFFRSTTPATFPSFKRKSMIGQWANKRHANKTSTYLLSQQHPTNWHSWSDNSTFRVPKTCWNSQDWQRPTWEMNA
jgi:hypothetical protein